MRELIRQRDADGLTFLMHAANSKGGTSRHAGPSERVGVAGTDNEEKVPIDHEAAPPRIGPAVMRQLATSGRDFNDYANAATMGFNLKASTTNLTSAVATGAKALASAAANAERVDHAVPVVKAAIAFLRETLWKEEVSAASAVDTRSRLLFDTNSRAVPGRPTGTWAGRTHVWGKLGGVGVSVGCSSA